MTWLLENLVHDLPTMVLLLVGLVIMWLRLSDVKTTVDSLKETCEERLKWCIDHFKSKD